METKKEWRNFRRKWGKFKLSVTFTVKIFMRDREVVFDYFQHLMVVPSKAQKSVCSPLEGRIKCIKFCTALTLTWMTHDAIYGYAKSHSNSSIHSQSLHTLMSARTRVPPQNAPLSHCFKIDWPVCKIVFGVSISWTKQWLNIVVGWTKSNCDCCYCCCMSIWEYSCNRIKIVINNWCETKQNQLQPKHVHLFRKLFFFCVISQAEVNWISDHQTYSI